MQGRDVPGVMCAAGIPRFGVVLKRSTYQVMGDGRFQKRGNSLRDRVVFCLCIRNCINRTFDREVSEIMGLLNHFTRHHEDVAAEAPTQKSSVKNPLDQLETAMEVLQKLDTNEQQGLTAAEAQKRLGEYGRNALESKKVPTWRKVLSGFWGPIPWMIEVAAILSVCVGHWLDFAVITFLLVFNAAIDYWNDHKATNALDALKNQLAPRARVKRDNSWSEIDASDLVPGDIIRVRLGDVIPADARLVEGDFISCDQAALTGESLPVAKKVDDNVYSGSAVKQGEMVAVVTATGSNTFFGRTAKLVGSAGNVSHFQKAVMRIGNFLIVLAVGLAILLSVVQIYRGEKFLSLLEFVLILVIASIPVAMPAVLSITMALGAIALAKEKAIVSKLQAIEEMAGVDILCSDKTGTLTKNQLTLGDPIVFAASDGQECILGGALASKEEDHDAIDLAVIGALDDHARLDAFEQINFVPFDPVGKRTESTVRKTDGSQSRYTKGAPQIIMDMAKLEEGKRNEAEKSINSLAKKGYRTLGVARSDDDGANWTFLGILPMFDPPRDDSAEVIEAAKGYGIKVKMVTGDNRAIGAETSAQLGLGINLLAADEVFDDEFDPNHLKEGLAKRIENADGFAQVFPEHKYAIVKSLQGSGHYVGMTGDGVNDAPALKQADIGLAVQGATDAARAAADVILTAPGLSAVVKAIQNSRQIFERMLSYTTYRIAMTINIMFFVVAATLFYQFEPLTAIAIILLALLDDIPIMAIAYDNTLINPKPAKFNMTELLITSSVLGFLGVCLTFVMLAFGWAIMHDPTWQAWFKGATGITMTTQHIQSMMFLQLVTSGHLLLFCTRTKSWFFSRPWPSWQLFSAIMGTQVLAIVMCGLGWLVPSIPWTLVAWVCVYCVATMFLIDLLKHFMLSIFHEHIRTKHHTKFLDMVNGPLSHHSHAHHQ